MHLINDDNSLGNSDPNGLTLLGGGSTKTGMMNGPAGSAAGMDTFKFQGESQSFKENLNQV